MKVVVYAICKNEEKFVSRWVASMGEADEIIVLDTGSTDNTVHLLKERNVTVFSKTYTHFRFDKARNDALKNVPQDADICVCTDLDEIFEKGWRQRLEKNWSAETGKLTYRYIFKADENNNELVAFMADKIHSRHGWKWKYPVHEVLVRVSTSPYVIRSDDSLKLLHLPDLTKSRADYLPLLRLQVKENPRDPRGYHYLGRELMFCEKYEEALSVFNRYICMPNTWDEERSATFRYMAFCCVKLNNGLQDCYFLSAIAQTPFIREPYAEYAEYLITQKEYDGAKFFIQRALKIKTPSLAFAMDSKIYSGLLEDLLKSIENPTQKA